MPNGIGILEKYTKLTVFRVMYKQAGTLSSKETALIQWVGLVLMALVLLLYLITLDNGLQPEELRGGDLITHQYAQVQARPSNAPGYPLYTMGGWLWFHGIRTIVRWIGISHPNPILILSSYSTLWALLSLWLFYYILCHITRTPQRPDGDWPLAGLLTAFYTVTYFFWYYATTTEQYSSAVAQTLAIVYVYLLWRKEVSGDTEYRIRDRGYWILDTSPATRLLLLLAFLCGLALAHMLTVAFIVPPLVVVVLWEVPALISNLRIVLGTVVAAMLPLLSYLYVYLRGASHPEWWGEGDWPDAYSWFWSFLSTAQGREELGWGFEPDRAFWGGGFPEEIWQELSIPLLILGLVGIAFLGRKLATLLYGTLLLYLLFCWAYRYGNWFQVILPAYPLILMGVAGCGLWTTRNRQQWPDTYFLSPISVPYSPILYFLLLLAFVWRLQASLPAADSYNRPGDTALDRAGTLLSQTQLPSHANLFATVDDTLAIQYLTEIWAFNPTQRTVSSLEAADRLRQGESVYATWEIAPTLQAELPAELALVVQNAGPTWIQFQTGESVLSNPSEEIQEPSISPLSETILPELDLKGYHAAIAPTSWLANANNQGNPVESGLDITLYWQLHGSTWPSGLSISVRPTSNGTFIQSQADTSAIVQQDRNQPIHDQLKLKGILPSTPFADAYRFSLPESQIAEVDGLMVILYRSSQTGFENVAVIEWAISE